MPIHFNNQCISQPNLLQQRALKEAYLFLYSLFGAEKEDHLILTSSGAESVNHAIFSAYLDITRKTGKNHFLCSALDEAPAIMAMSRLQECGCHFEMIPACPEGYVSEQTVTEMLSPRTAMLSLSWANGLTGVIQPIMEIGRLCKQRGILFHLDATHTIGKGDYLFQESGADLLSFNGPLPGTGFLLIRSGVEMSPFILGGHQQGGMRGGDFNASQLIELGKWAKELKSHTDHYSVEVARLRVLFDTLIAQAIPNVQILFQQQERLPHISSMIFPGVTSDALYYRLSQKGILATIGGGHFQNFSHLLKACKIPAPNCYCGMSFALSHEMEEEEIRQGAHAIVESVLHLQKYSEELVRK